jgi:hypothetical protein
MILAACANPHGPGMLLYPLKTVSIGILRDYIQEWQTPEFHSISMQPFAWLMILTFGAVGASRKNIAFIDFALVGLFFYMGLLAGRNVALFSIVAPMVLTRHAALALDDVKNSLGIHTAPRLPGKRNAYVNVLILILLVATVVLKVSSIYPEKANEAAFRGSLPVGAVEFLNEYQPEGRLFNSYNWGGYLLLELPQYPVFVDGRTDLYNDELITKWLTVVSGDVGWQSILEEYAINLILIEPESILNRTLPLDPDWASIYQDSISILYQRR